MKKKNKLRKKGLSWQCHRRLRLKYKYPYVNVEERQNPKDIFREINNVNNNDDIYKYDYKILNDVWEEDYHTIADEADIFQHTINQLIESIVRPLIYFRKRIRIKNIVKLYIPFSNKANSVLLQHCVNNFDDFIKIPNNLKINIQGIDNSHQNEKRIEVRLAKHFIMLRNFLNNPSKVRTYIIKSICEISGKSNHLDFIDSLINKFFFTDELYYYDYAYVIGWICLFSPFWVRDPNTWSPNSKNSLCDHLFVLYERPKFMNLFYSYGGHFKWLCWLILIGQGGSLKKAGKIFNWKINSKFQYYLMKVPPFNEIIERPIIFGYYDYNDEIYYEFDYIIHSCMYAEVLRLGGSKNDFIRLLRNEVFIIDPTEISNSDDFFKFWQDTVLWHIKHSSEISDKDSEKILEWAMHEYTEAENDRRKFLWKKQHVNTVLQKSTEYQIKYFRKSYYKARYNCFWKSHDINYEFTEGPNNHWSFTEILSSFGLQNEGKMMNHCVYGRESLCMSGKSAIVSVKYNFNRCLTVEINPRTLFIKEAKGRKNRAPSAKEIEILCIWIQKLKSTSA